MRAVTQSGAVSDIWAKWTDENDDERFWLKCLGIRNCEKGIFLKFKVIKRIILSS